MTPARQELIANWRNQLDEASHVQADAASRAVWLRRLRRRLYRFLLSVYGDGGWNAAMSNDAAAFSGVSAGVSGLENLPGEPREPKDPAIIRHTLHSIAAAHEQHPPGPFSQEYNRDRWIVVASAAKGLSPQLCHAALAAKGIPARLVTQAGPLVVEVPLHHRSAARNLIVTNLERLLPGTQVSAGRTPAQMAPAKVDNRWKFLMWGASFVALFQAALLIVAANVLLTRSPDIRATVAAFLYDSSVWLSGCALVLILEVLLLLNLRKRRLGASAYRLRAAMRDGT